MANARQYFSVIMSLTSRTSPNQYVLLLRRNFWDYIFPNSFICSPDFWPLVSPYANLWGLIWQSNSTVQSVSFSCPRYAHWINLCDVGFNACNSGKVFAFNSHLLAITVTVPVSILSLTWYPGLRMGCNHTLVRNDRTTRVSVFGIYTNLDTSEANFRLIEELLSGKKRDGL